MPASVLEDKIRGGLLGHLLGDLNGLVHEMKYIAEPGKVESYTPALPQGAWTDDDTDFEWVYVVAMQQRKMMRIPYREISDLWKTHINRLFWCANQYARQLMDLGMDPPLTGHTQFNPWSDFNISGQFVCESFGLMAPGMPQTAARMGLHYTHVTIDGEPAQTTQLFDTMIATAFLTNDLQTILDAGQAAVDPASEVYQVVKDVRVWHARYPRDWRMARRMVKEKYSRYQGAMRDRNGYELNTASVIGALLYGEGDYLKTSITAFNFGWDADNNAATACTIIGVLKGAQWMQAQGWKIRDVYRNTSRDQMPRDETITRFGDRLVALAEQVILEQGGNKFEREGQFYYRIRIQEPANIEKILNPAAQMERLREELDIERGLIQAADTQQRARAAYQAICLDLAPSLRAKYPEAWSAAIKSLQEYPKVIGVLFFEAGTPAGDRLRTRALAAGLKKPEQKTKLW